MLQEMLADRTKNMLFEANCRHLSTIRLEHTVFAADTKMTFSKRVADICRRFASRAPLSQPPRKNILLESNHVQLATSRLENAVFVAPTGKSLREASR